MVSFSVQCGCSASEFQCVSLDPIVCIPLSQQNDGYAQCSDYSDEGKYYTQMSYISVHYHMYHMYITCVEHI